MGSEQNRKYRDLPHTPYHKCIASSTINITNQCEILVRNDEYVLTYHNHLESVVYTLEFTLGVVRSVGLDKYVMTCIYCYSIQTIFIVLKILCVHLLCVHPSFPQPLAISNDLFTLSITLPFLECRTVGIIQ